MMAARNSPPASDPGGHLRTSVSSHWLYAGISHFLCFHLLCFMSAFTGLKRKCAVVLQICLITYQSKWQLLE
ncbi:hypothetical protein OH77DRAFT_1320426 [Trametes cingulata]|nr:hypothetical protein OH77DRAFT_1320426 [Trametes cingulata]